MLTGLIVCFSFLGFKPPFRCMDRSFTASSSSSSTVICLNALPAIRGLLQKSLIRAQSDVSMPSICIRFRQRLRFRRSSSRSFCRHSSCPLSFSRAVHQASYSLAVISFRLSVRFHVYCSTMLFLNSSRSPVQGSLLNNV